jgi:hypothetical protein
VAKNSSLSGIKHILDLAINATHTNVIQLSVPHRQDLINESCVNREVKVFNNNLRNRLKHFNNVEMIRVTSEREMFTRHGQHLNSRGKETMANKIALSIEDVLKRKVDPINMKWLQNNGMDSQEHIEQTHRANVLKEIPEDPEDPQEDEPPTIPNIQHMMSAMEPRLRQPDLQRHLKSGNPVLTTSTAQINAPTRTSSRVKKTPYTMNVDILWTTGPPTRVCHQPV